MGRLIVRADESDDSEVRKNFITAGLECGIGRFVMRREDKGFLRLGKFDAIYPDDEKIETVNITDSKSQQYAMSLAGKKDTVIVTTSDWKVIPMENIIGSYHNSGTELYAVADNREDAKLFLTTMEKGVDAVIIDVDDPNKIHEFADLASSSSKIELSEIKVKSIKSVEMGDRVCIDTCVSMTPGEGMLIGSFSDCLFLVQSESEESKYVSSRPFRVNAGAVHSYIQTSSERTGYISEISSGDSVLICDSEGNTRIATIGRCKIEKRPLLMVKASDGKKDYSVILQNAETVRLVTPNGSISITELKEGDVILAKMSSGGRHFGMSVDETISEI